MDFLMTSRSEPRRRFDSIDSCHFFFFCGRPRPWHGWTSELRLSTSNDDDDYSRLSHSIQAKEEIDTIATALYRCHRRAASSNNEDDVESNYNNGNNNKSTSVTTQRSRHCQQQQ